MSVTPPKPKDVLLIVAARLSKAAPNTWAEFVTAMEVYVREAELACVKAPADAVLLAQGRARQCHDLLTIFHDAVKQK